MLTSSFLDGQQTFQIRISGRFDFGVHQEFRRAYESAPAARVFVVDLAETEYMDSSALGMLLVLRDAAQKQNAEVRLANPRPSVRRILSMVNFERLFQVA